jgi:hypothetical protein
MLYLPGRKNVVADLLSRPSPPEPTGNVAAAAAADPVDFEAMAEAIPLVETSAAACAKALTFSWMRGRGEPCGEAFLCIEIN